jgi:hypothetical protein
MRYIQHFAGFALAVGVMLSGASTLSAADWRDSHYDHQDFRRGFYETDRLRAGIARDRARLNGDLRCHRYDAARRDRADLERDERQLDRYGRRW